MSIKNIAFTLNREKVSVLAEPGEMLVDVLRDKLGLTGTKIGCRAGDCGACTVILNGAAVNSCLIPLGKAEGAQLQTIEGVAYDDRLHPVQQALMDNGAVQCGFCFPGMVMSAKALLDQNVNPTKEEVRTAIAGNICRCTGYTKIEEAVTDAAQRMHHCQCGEGGCYSDNAAEG